MEHKVSCQKNYLETTPTFHQQSYDPYDGLVQVRFSPTGKEDLGTVYMDMKEVMGNVLYSPVLVSSCYLQRVEIKEEGRDWNVGLEELKEMRHSCTETDTLEVENKATAILEYDEGNSERKKFKQALNQDSEETRDTDSSPKSLEQVHFQTASGLHKFSTKRCIGSVPTSLFVTGAGKEVKTKDASNEWAKSFLASVAVPESDQNPNNDKSLIDFPPKKEKPLEGDSSIERNKAIDGSKQGLTFTTGKGKHLSISNESLQHASMVLKEGLTEKAPVSSKLGPKRKLTNSVLKRARSALYDNQTPKKTNDSGNYTRDNECRVPLLRSYPDSILPMKRTPSGITDSMLKRRGRVGNSSEISDSCIPKSASARKVKKRISFHYVCTSITGQRITDMKNVKKVSLKQLRERKSQDFRNIFSDDPELWDCVRDPLHFRFKNNRMNLEKNFSLSPDLPASLRPDSRFTVGVEEFTEHLRQLFPDADGPVMKVGTNAWIRNAYRLLVWKLASFEIFFHPLLTNKLNAVNLSIEFSKRLEREWNLGHRSILHKIVERDALVGAHHVLFISDIFDEEFIELSDGWYCVRAKVDSFLGDAIREKKLVKGCKISICSASFYHLDEEHPENTVLSLHFNGVRRARWDSKLGLRRYPPVLHTMNSIRALGGQIPCIEVVIERSFPVRFVEKEVVDESTTRKVFRNEEDEERIVLRRNEDISIRLDELFKREERSLPIVDWERDVSRMTEILVVDRRGKKRAYVTFWRPTDNALEILRNEGYVIRLYGVIPSKQLFDSETLHLAMPSKMPIQLCSTETSDTFWIPRYSLSVSSIGSLSSGEEFDSSFVILLVGELQYGHTRFIYLIQSLQSPIIAVKLSDEQAQNIPSVIKRATGSSNQKVALVSVKNLKFICCDKRCGLYLCHHTSRCVWLSERESKNTAQFLDPITRLQKLVQENHSRFMALRQQLLDFVHGKITNLYFLREEKVARVWEILNESLVHENE
ncbi:hypothetical protein GAYE_SCF20G4111 [Galdieria yellowstonensis]|uniref:Uncharacterized protein n=1 Tax=Galdieria yellowstonensis TaxID=3028027 RepID=A0AAV9IFH9_9RHOD|nr:hypothetical protein GAYE_SCF20G4111 [Galdieria yellowstonensis]